MKGRRKKVRERRKDGKKEGRQKGRQRKKERKTKGRWEGREEGREERREERREEGRSLTTVMSSLSNHCSLSSARGHMSGRRAVFIRLTQRRVSSSPGEPATLVLSFTCTGRRTSARPAGSQPQEGSDGACALDF